MLDQSQIPSSPLPAFGGPKREAAEAAMRRAWWPVARSIDLATPQPAILLGERLVVYRTESGRAVVQSRRWQGPRRYYYTVPYGPYYIWGATARMLRAWTERMM